MKTWTVKTGFVLLTQAMLLFTLILPLLLFPAKVETASDIPNMIQVRITAVVDGDTVWATINQVEESIRLIGVDTPEVGRWPEPFGREAGAFTRENLYQRTVWLEIGARERDRHGRLLAYVWLERPTVIDEASIRGKMFNSRLLLEGYARMLIIAPNDRYAAIFGTFQQEARNAGRRLWETMGDLVVSPFRGSMDMGRATETSWLNP